MLLWQCISLLFLMNWLYERPVNLQDPEAMQDEQPEDVEEEDPVVQNEEGEAEPTEVPEVIESQKQNKQSPSRTQTCIKTGNCKRQGKSARMLRSFDHSFLALLYSSKDPDRVCTGAIITRRWILDNCLDSHKYKFDHAKVGVNDIGGSYADYDVDRFYRHHHYARVPFASYNFNTSLLWAARSAIVLHHTTRNIQFVTKLVMPISIYQSYDTPATGTVVYLNNKFLVYRNVYTMATGCCNQHFYRYFNEWRTTWCIQTEQYCIQTYSITASECCQGQALMICGGRLLGVMGWSTACSLDQGVDPWVFTHVRYFLTWINSICHETICKDCRE